MSDRAGSDCADQNDDFRPMSVSMVEALDDLFLFDLNENKMSVDGGSESDCDSEISESAAVEKELKLQNYHKNVDIMDPILSPTIAKSANFSKVMEKKKPDCLENIGDSLLSFTRSHQSSSSRDSSICSSIGDLSYDSKEEEVEEDNGLNEKGSNLEISREGILTSSHLDALNGLSSASSDVTSSVDRRHTDVYSSTALLDFESSITDLNGNMKNTVQENSFRSSTAALGNGGAIFGGGWDGAIRTNTAGCANNSNTLSPNSQNYRRATTGMLSDEKLHFFEDNFGRDFFYQQLGRSSIDMLYQDINKFDFANGRSDIKSKSRSSNRKPNRTIVKEGWLMKKGSVMKNWKKRWFVLSISATGPKDPVLAYFKDKKDNSPRSSLELGCTASVFSSTDNNSNNSGMGGKSCNDGKGMSGLGSHHLGKNLTNTHKNNSSGLSSNVSNNTSAANGSGNGGSGNANVVKDNNTFKLFFSTDVSERTLDLSADSSFTRSKWLNALEKTIAQANRHRAKLLGLSSIFEEYGLGGFLVRFGLRKQHGRGGHFQTRLLEFNFLSQEIHVTKRGETMQTIPFCQIEQVKVVHDYSHYIDNQKKKKKRGHRSPPTTSSTSTSDSLTKEKDHHFSFIPRRRSSRNKKKNVSYEVANDHKGHHQGSLEENNKYVNKSSKTDKHSSSTHPASESNFAVEIILKIPAGPFGVNNSPNSSFNPFKRNATHDAKDNDTSDLDWLLLLDTRHARDQLVELFSAIIEQKPLYDLLTRLHHGFILKTGHMERKKAHAASPSIGLQATLKGRLYFVLREYVLEVYPDENNIPASQSGGSSASLTSHLTSSSHSNISSVSTTPSNTNHSVAALPSRQWQTPPNPFNSHGIGCGIRRPWFVFDLQGLSTLTLMNNNNVNNCSTLKNRGIWCELHKRMLFIGSPRHGFHCGSLDQCNDWYIAIKSSMQIPIEFVQVENEKRLKIQKKFHQTLFRIEQLLSQKISNGNNNVLQNSNEKQALGMLQTLWVTVFPGEPWPGYSSEKWQEIGFQRGGPAADLRASGLFGLHCLLYFVKQYPDVFTSIIVSQQAELTGGRFLQYPVAIACINVVLMLVDMMALGQSSVHSEGCSSITPQVFVKFVANTLDHHSDRGNFRKRSLKKELKRLGNSGDGFSKNSKNMREAVTESSLTEQPVMLDAVVLDREWIELMKNSENVVFEEMFCTLFPILDRLFIEMGAGYMEFGQVLSALRRRVEVIFSMFPQTFEDLQLLADEPCTDTLVSTVNDFK